MQFHWRQNRLPAASVAEGESPLLAEFLEAEIGLSRAKAKSALEALSAGPEAAWAGDAMELDRDGDAVLIAHQFADDDAEPEEAPLPLFVEAVRAWAAFVADGPSDAVAEVPRRS